MVEPERLAALFAAHAGPLTLYARQFDPANADELVQEAFIRLLGAPVEPPAVRPWLLLTIRRLATDRKRSWFRRRRHERANVPTTPWFEPHDGDGLDAQAATSLLASLPARQREIVVLRIWNGLTLAAIAEVVGVSTGTVHAEFAAALTTLRIRMEVEPCTKTTRT